MKQSDLLKLLGLPVTDLLLMSFFEERGLLLPQNVAVVKPNSMTPLSIKNSVGIKDKGWGFSYYFRSELINEHFPVIQEDRNYIPYFSQVIFDGKLYEKRERKEPATFWDISPAPDSGMESITSHFGQFATDRKFPQLRSSFSPQVEIIVRALLPEENRINGYFATLVESYELLHKSEFDTRKSRTAKWAAMLIKWLSDHKYLSTTLPLSPELNGISEVLDFIHESLNGHLWESQLIGDPQLRRFVRKVIEGKSGYESKLYRFSGKTEPYESLDWEAQTQWIEALPFNEENYAIFKEALNQSFSEYKTL